MQTPYVAAADRYAAMPYRRTGRSGLDLPAISLGLWQNFGGADVFETGRAILRRAFDLGVTHFDLANNYGPPYGSAEENFGKVMAADFAAHRDELIVSTKAGWDMWPGPYGKIGGSRKYLIASCDQSLKRMGLDYVDIFYSHRVDPTTPLEETMGALAHLHRQLAVRYRLHVEAVVEARHAVGHRPDAALDQERVAAAERHGQRGHGSVASGGIKLPCAAEVEP